MRLGGKESPWILIVKLYQGTTWMTSLCQCGYAASVDNVDN